MAQYGRPISDVSAGGWTASPLYAKIDETPFSDTDYLTSAKNASVDAFECALTNTLGDPSLSSGHTIRVRLRCSKTNNGTAVVYLYQGASLIATYSVPGYLGSSFASYTYDLASGETDNITDYTDLRIRVEGTCTANAYIYCSWAELEIPDAAPPADELTADDLTGGIPVLGSPDIGQVHVFGASGITTGAPVLGSPDIGQVHALGAPGFAAGAPVLGTPDLSEAPNIDELTADDLTAGVPVLGSPDIGQVHELEALGVDAGAPIVGYPDIGQKHNIIASGLDTGAPILGSPDLGQVHELVASGITTGVPVFGTPTLTENLPDIDNLIADDLTTGTPVLGSPNIGQVHILGASGLAAGAPVLGSPDLSEVVPTDDLQALDLVSGIPAIGSPDLGQIHYLVALGLSSGIPIFEDPELDKSPYIPSKRRYIKCYAENRIDNITRDNRIVKVKPSGR